tara:strand:- start:215 stop:457 length:243 start_codon:yes stop_codon:yes gene_type:complete
MNELVLVGLFLVFVTLLISLLVMHIKIGDEFRETREVQHLQLMALYRLLQNADVMAGGRFGESDEMKVYMSKYLAAHRNN